MFEQGVLGVASLGACIGVELRSVGACDVYRWACLLLLYHIRLENLNFAAPTTASEYHRQVRGRCYGGQHVRQKSDPFRI